MCQDAGWCNWPDDLFQSGTVLTLACKKTTIETIINISFIEWSFRRIKRVVRSSLATEVHGLSLAAWWHELKSGKELDATTLQSVSVAEPLFVCVDCNNIHHHFVQVGGAPLISGPTSSSKFCNRRCERRLCNCVGLSCG